MKHDNPKLLAKRIRTVARMAILEGLRRARKAIQAACADIDFDEPDADPAGDLLDCIEAGCLVKAEALRSQIQTILDQERADCERRAAEAAEAIIEANRKKAEGTE